MKPNYEKAAAAAMETLIKNGISTAPVDPIPIYKRAPGVLVLSFAEMSSNVGIDRQDLVSLFGENQDAATFHFPGEKLRYIVAYNQRLPFYMVQRALARELGHIVLGHDGSRPEEVRTAEALCFAQHLLCPRPLLYAIQEAGVPLTLEVVGNVTGCYERCMAGMRKFPGVRVPAELNRAVRDLFSEYINNFLAFQPFLTWDDRSAIADFGSFMEGYEE